MTTTDILLNFCKQYNTGDWALSVGLAKDQIVVFVAKKKDIPKSIPDKYENLSVKVEVTGQFRPL